MERLKALDPETATGKSKELFDGIQSKLGMVPNMMRTMGNSPAVLEGYLNLSGALSTGTLGAKTGEILASAIAETNSCEYCAAAHDFIGQNLVKIPAIELESARNGRSQDAKTQAAITFAKTLINKQGKVDAQDVSSVKEAGYTDGEVGEIVAHVALNVFTNYFNNTAGTVVDFPQLQT